MNRVRDIISNKDGVLARILLGEEVNVLVSSRRELLELLEVTTEVTIHVYRYLGEEMGQFKAIQVEHSANMPADFMKKYWNKLTELTKDRWQRGVIIPRSRKKTIVL